MASTPAARLARAALCFTLPLAVPAHARAARPASSQRGIAAPPESFSPPSGPVDRIPNSPLLQSLRLHSPSDRFDENPFASVDFGRFDGNGSGGYSPAVFSELRRLFNQPSTEDDMDVNRFGLKALLAAPLMRRHNGSQLLARPMGTIYTTFAKRVALRSLRGLDKIEPPPGSIAIDTHTHTAYSHDSVADVSQMLIAAAHRGLSGIAVTDHDTFEGARVGMETARRLIQAGRLPSGFLVIPGEEISSARGHIIGLFLTREIPAGMSLAATIDAIHQQGGIAVAAHPELADGVSEAANRLPFDAVETENGAEVTHFAMGGDRARDRRAEFYATVTKPRLGASDAHDPGAVGMCYTVLPCPADLQAIRTAILAGQSSPECRLSEADLKQEMHHGPTGLLLSLHSTVDLHSSGFDHWLRKSTHADTARLSIWPRPGLTWARSF